MASPPVWIASGWDESPQHPFGRVDICDVYESLIWAERYHDWGDVQMDVPLSPMNRARFAEGRLLMIPGHDMTARIEAAEIRDEAGRRTIRVIATDIRAMLDLRAVGEPVSATRVDALIRKIIGDGTAQYPGQYSGVRALPITLGAAVQCGGRVQASYCVLGERIRALARSAGVGTRAVRTAGASAELEIYRGVDRSDSVIVSRQMDTLGASRARYDRRNFLNRVLVAGQGEGAERARLWVTVPGDAMGAGAQLRESVLDDRMSEAGVTTAAGALAGLGTGYKRHAGLDRVTWDADKSDVVLMAWIGTQSAEAISTGKDMDPNDPDGTAGTVPERIGGAEHYGPDFGAADTLAGYIGDWGADGWTVFTAYHNTYSVLGVPQVAQGDFALYFSGGGHTALVFAGS